MLVWSIRKPWTTSALVALKLMRVPVGTRMHCGVNENCCPIARTVTEPSASTALPRLLSTNSPEMCSVCGFAVSTQACGIVARWMPAKIAMPISKPTIPADMIVHRRSMRAATAAPSSWSGVVVIRWLPSSLHRSPRQEDHEIKGKPQRDDDRRRNACDDNGALRAGPYDLVDPGVLGFRRRRGVPGNDHGVLTAVARSGARWLRMRKQRLRGCPRKRGCRSQRRQTHHPKAIVRGVASREASDCRPSPADSRH